MENENNADSNELSQRQRTPWVTILFGLFVLYVFLSGPIFAISYRQWVAAGSPDNSTELDFWWKMYKPLLYVIPEHVLIGYGGVWDDILP